MKGAKKNLKRKFLVGIDTETCNSLVVDDKLDLTNSLVYDVGWAVIDKKGNVYKTRSYVVFEIFCKMKDVMKSAYYAEKIPQYWDDIKNGKRTLATFATIRKEFLKDLKEYNTNVVFAHNAGFDLRALNNTYRYITKSKYRYFFKYGTEIWDTLKMSREVLKNNDTYGEFCYENNFLTSRMCKRFTAEVIFRFLTGALDFEESHTGLEDVLIEKEIFSYCLEQNPEIDGRLWKD